MTATKHDRFTAYHADTIEVARAMPDESVDYSIFSPPFASLYTYSNSERDLGNCKSDEDFFAHMRYLIAEQFRVMAPGRNLSIHCMLMPTSKERDGYIGLKDFRGDLIRAYQAAGFIYHSEVCIWKNPVIAMQRTHAIGLLHNQLCKDSSISRQGIPDYLVTMRKPGVNVKPIQHWDTDPRDGSVRGVPGTHEFPVSRWQHYASPVWMDIDSGDTLQHRSAREEEDERHICPLQLTVIRRGIELWSRPEDIVWSPFMGIGSEGVVALEEGRRFIGAELKASYYEQAVKNLTVAASTKQVDLFAGGGK
jgi:DNA modification methylase